MLAVGMGQNPRESLSGLARLGARLIIQRAVEDEFDAWLGRFAMSTGPRASVGCATTVTGTAAPPKKQHSDPLVELVVARRRVSVVTETVCEIVAWLSIAV